MLPVHQPSTGVKCLPANRLPKHGDVLHDSHAEVVARRGFILWLYEELTRLERSTSSSTLTGQQQTSEYLEEASLDGDCGQGKYRLRGEWKLCLYVSTLPCESDCLRVVAPPPLRPRTTPPTDSSTPHLHLTSPAPGGDASMLHLATTQDPAMAANYADQDTSISSTTLSRGRTGYLHQGALRTKPGVQRPPSPRCATPVN